MSLRIYRGDISTRQEAMEILIADGWDKVGAEAILDTCEEQNHFVNEAELLKISADYKDR